MTVLPANESRIKRVRLHWRTPKLGSGRTVHIFLPCYKYPLFPKLIPYPHIPCFTTYALASAKLRARFTSFHPVPVAYERNVANALYPASRRSTIIMPIATSIQ